MEAAQLAAHLAHARQQLGLESAWVRAWPTGAKSGPKSGTELERELTGWLRLTRLQQGAERLRLLEEAAPADEPLLRLAAALVPLHRALAREQEHQVKQPLLGQTEALARARWRVLGDEEAPDATFTLRLSFGRIAEVTSAGLRHPWQTTFGGLFARSDAFAGQPPFQLSPRLAAARAQLDARAPLNFIATADIVGGNSGSPVLNAAGEWIGVAFDGNLDSLAGSYHFDEASNRMVVLHQRALQMALRQVYDAGHLAKELGL
jgi:Peptidase S46